MNFSKALDTLKNGGLITRIGWHKPGMYLTLQKPDEHSKMTAPYIYITIREGVDDVERVPWVASQSDIMAEDWDQITED